MLRSTARDAVAWSTADLFLRKGIGFCITVSLARLLVPEDFGTLALLSLFLGLAELFVNAGFSAALIQKKVISHLDESTVFWFNIVASVVITILVFCLAPLVATAFELPVLAPLTMLMACTIPINAAGSIHNTLLIKALNFRTPLKIGVVVMIFSGAIAIYMAWAGYGVWALAGQAVSASVVNTLLLWFMSSWRPLLDFSIDSCRRLVGFGGWLFASWILGTVYERGYTLLIGKFHGTHSLGIYNRADTTQQLAADLLSGVLNRVAFPMFSSINGDTDKLRRGVRLSARSIMLVSAPAMLGMAATANSLIEVVFGNQWLPAVPILQILCVAGLLFPLHVINLNVLQAQGYGKLYFKLEIFKKSIGTVLLILGAYYWGIMGIAWSRVLQSVIALCINGHYTQVHLGYGVFEQVKDVSPSILLSVLMGAILLFLESYMALDGVFKLASLIAIGAGFFIVANILIRSESYKEALVFIKGET